MLGEKGDLRCIAFDGCEKERKRFIWSESREVCMSKQNSTSTFVGHEDRTGRKGVTSIYCPIPMPEPFHSWPSLTLPWKNGRSLPPSSPYSPSTQNHPQRKSARDQHRFAIIGERTNAIRRMMQFQRHDVDVLGRWMIGCVWDMGLSREACSSEPLDSMTLRAAAGFGRVKVGAG